MSGFQFSISLPVIMTDFERNYFGTGPRPTALSVALPRKRGVLVRSNSNRDAAAQLTDEWQPEEEISNGGDRRTSSLRRPVGITNGNPTASSTSGGGVGVAVKKEVNFVSPTKSDAEPVHSTNRQRITSNLSDPRTQQQPNPRPRQDTETGSSFEEQPHRVRHQRGQVSGSSGAEEEEGCVARERNKSARQETNYSTGLSGNSKRDLPRTQGTSDKDGRGGQKENEKPSIAAAGDGGDWNTAAEAVSYYSDSTGSNSVTMASAAVATPRPARIHASSWSLSSHCGNGLSRTATIHDDNRFGTIRSVQSECRTSSTSQLNRSGSLKRIKGRSNHSLCSCDAETEVRHLPSQPQTNGL